MKSLAKQRLPLALASVLSCVTLCSHARAFQNPGRFLEDPVAKGGGGQRLFTGSPADGYTCKACHAPGEPVHVDVAGLPLDGYVPGQSYTITIKWPDELKAVGLNAEFTDQSGAALGKLSTLPPNQLSPNDLCRMGRQSGANILPLPTRSVLVLAECGQHQTTMSWTAPAEPPAGSGWFSGSLVVSDGKGDLAGDQVTDFRRVLAQASSSAGASSSISAHTADFGCSVLLADAHSTALTWSTLVLVAVRLRSRRRARFVARLA